MLSRFCAAHGLPTIAMWQQGPSACLRQARQGDSIVCEHFRSLFEAPSLMEPFLSEALSKGVTVWTCDAGELTGQLPVLRIVGAHFTRLETQLAYARQSAAQALRNFDEALRETVTMTIKRCAEVQLGRIAQDVIEEAHRLANPEKAAAYEANRQKVAAILAEAQAFEGSVPLRKNSTSSNETAWQAGPTKESAN